MADDAFARPQTHAQADERHDEEWRICPAFPDYEASSFGRVRRRTASINTAAGRPLKPIQRKSGYWQVGVRRDGKLCAVRLNRLICETFHGCAPSSRHHAAHKDNDRSNNRPDNLRWATQIENEADKTAAGTRPLGSLHKRSKLNEEAVRLIREHPFDKRSSSKDLAGRFGVSISLIQSIRRGKGWAHV
jgi:hypothetical protein